jgi:hypothetical protein
MFVFQCHFYVMCDIVCVQYDTTAAQSYTGIIIMACFNPARLGYMMDLWNVYNVDVNCIP